MRAAVLALTLGLLPGAAYAQLGNAGFLAPDTRLDSAGLPVPDQLNATDKLFAQLLAEGGMAEVDFGQLATDSAQSTVVNDYARRMIDDHSTANTELASLAEAAGVPLPDQLNAEHAMLRTQLDDLEETAFDLAYMRSQVVDHQKATQLLIWEIGSGQHAELQQFAAATLPTVLEHLRIARSIVDELVSGQIASSADN